VFVFVFGSDFLFFRDRILGGSRCLKKKSCQTRKRGHYCTCYNCAISPSQPPFIAYNIAQYIFPTTPFIAIKYWQYLVRANGQRRGEPIFFVFLYTNLSNFEGQRTNYSS